MNHRVGIVPFLALLLGTCWGCGPRVSDTGYEGTWSRGNERLSSTVSIVKLGEQYRFRVFQESADGKLNMVWDWDGRGRRVFSGETTMEYAVRTWLDPESGHLMVGYDVTPKADGEEPSSLVDELILEPGGLELGVYTVERNGERLDEGRRPMRTFRKVSDEVVSPPGAPGY